MADSEDKVVYLMRGLSGSGKSHRAKRLAGAGGAVCETDAFFKGSGAVEVNGDAISAAKAWNFQQFQTALEQGISPVVVDRGSGLSIETQRYAALALEHGYAVEFQEPDSPWWQEIRVLLKYREFNVPVLEVWAGKLAQLRPQSCHLSEELIWKHMCNWRSDLTVKEVLVLKTPTSIEQAAPVSNVEALLAEMPASQQKAPETLADENDWLSEMLAGSDK